MAVGAELSDDDDGDAAPPKSSITSQPQSKSEGVVFDRLAAPAHGGYFIGDARVFADASISKCSHLSNYYSCMISRRAGIWHSLIRAAKCWRRRPSTRAIVEISRRACRLLRSADRRPVFKNDAALEPVLGDAGSRWMRHGKYDISSRCSIHMIDYGRSLPCAARLTSRNYTSGCSDSEARPRQPRKCRHTASRALHHRRISGRSGQHR